MFAYIEWYVIPEKYVEIIFTQISDLNLIFAQKKMIWIE